MSSWGRIARLFALVVVVSTCGGEPGAPVRRVAKVLISPATDTLLPGQTLQLTATLRDEAGDPMTGPVVNWISDDAATATISDAGLVNARRPGLVTIRAVADTAKGTASITVLVPVAAIEVTPESLSIAQGSGQQLTAVAKDSTGAVLDGRTVTWSSADVSKLVVSPTGFVTGLGAADVIVTARYEAVTGSATVHVIGPVARVTITPSVDTVVIGDSVQLAATPTDAAGHARLDRPVSWSTADYQLRVTTSGVVDGVAGGVGTVGATSDGVSGGATIHVVMDTFPVVLGATTGRTCVLSGRGIVYCWGDIVFPVPGITTGDQTAQIPAPVRLPTSLVATDLAVAPAHACMLTASQAAYCWGSNTSGQLGNDTVSHICTAGYLCAPVPVPVLGGLTFVRIEGGYYDTCGITTNGSAYCWGGNLRGEVGDGSSTIRSTPVAVSGNLRFRSISVGWFHTCGVTTDSLAYCWGDNNSGQLGGGTIDDTTHSTPQPVSGGLTFVSVFAGASHSCAITDSGVIYCWGANDVGQLGGGDAPAGCQPSACSTPIQVAGSFRSVSAGERHTCAISDTDDAFCWGQGTSYQLGDRSGVNFSTPRLVVGALKWRSISAGEVHTCGVSTANVTYCWGGNVPALGTGDSSTKDTPTRVLGQR